jgi:hypothetical protein
MTLSQSPTPGWYADPQGLQSYRWWDGQSWTAHATNGPSPAAVGVPAHSGLYGGPMTAAAAAPTQWRPAATASGWQRNKLAFITVGIVAVYVILALKAHVYILGILPVMMSIRSKNQNEPLAIVAIMAAAVAVLIAVVGLTGH